MYLSFHPTSMRILIFFTFLLYVKAGIIHDSGEEQGLEQKPKRKPVTKEVMRSIYEKGFAKNENRTYQEPEFTRTLRIVDENIVDVVVDFYNKTVFFGRKIDFDFTSNGTDTNFVFESIVTSHNPQEELHFDVKGTVNGKTVNEKGMITFKWDKITLKVKAGITDKSDGYRDIAVAITECFNPVTKVGGLPKEIAGRLEEAIYNSLMEKWESTFEIEKDKETKHGKSYNACRKIK